MTPALKGNGGEQDQGGEVEISGSLELIGESA